MFFDGGEFWGRDPKYGLEQSRESLKLKKLGLMSHFEAVFFDMETGNEKTIALAKKYPGRFVPMAVINPFHYDASRRYLERLKRQGFKGFCLLSYYQYWKLNQYSVSSLASEFSRAGLPVQIGVASTEELAFAAEAFKKVSVPVLIRWLRGGGYNAIADEIAIAKDCPNFFFDVGNLTSLNSIRYLAEAIGSRRLYIATNSPLVYDLPSRLLLQYGGLSLTDYEQISWKTLAAIFKISPKRLPVSDGIMSKEEKSVVVHHLVRPKIDPHWHSEGWDIIEPGKDSASFKKVMDVCHYQAVIVSSILALNYDMQAGNRNVAALVKKDPRIYGYIVVDPTRVEASLREIEKYSGNKRFVGIKTIQDYYNAGLDDERYKRILALAEEKSLPVLCHRGGVVATAKNFPKLTFLVAHITRERLREMPEMIRLPNIFFDISGSYAHKGETNLLEIIKTVGSERVLYSSDGPSIAPYWALGKIAETPLSDTEKDNIYMNNALNIFPALR